MTDRFGPFRIVAPIGRGGMSETHVAERDLGAGVVQRVCLKRLRNAEASDPRWISMFQTEARVVAALVHPNIVPLLDFGREGATWWMALALVEGADLRAILTHLRGTGERLPVDAVVVVAREVAKALSYAHARRDARGEPLGLIHRDVSPGNILVSTEGAVLLTDFGIAKVSHGERTRSGEIKGKAVYMAPEQSLGPDFDARADLFALGVVMFELLTGRRPFDGRSPVATYQNAVMGRRSSVLALAPDVPAALVALVDDLLMAERERRVASAEVVIARLGEVAARSDGARALAGISGAVVRAR